MKVKVDTSEILGKIEQVINILNKEGLTNIANRIENIYYNRAIWDKMALTLFNELKCLSKTRILKEELSSIIQDLISLLEPSTTKLGYDYYKIAKDVARQLADLGHQDWAVRINEAIEAGSTGTEILMALRWNMNKIKESNLEIPEATKYLIEEFLFNVGEVLK